METFPFHFVGENKTKISRSTEVEKKKHQEYNLFIQIKKVLKKIEINQKNQKKYEQKTLLEYWKKTSDNKSIKHASILIYSMFY